ncbi:CoA-transferase [Domibacillus iocasae]|uniref:CoA-transferase n=1 Tax=Domibacillus iocasae TaxID=1714016 RepID=UPI00114C931A|nr:CoA-transferase [Domibacillus iocasae]
MVVGGLELCGILKKAIEAFREQGMKGLTIYSNNYGLDDWELGLLLANKYIERDEVKE